MHVGCKYKKGDIIKGLQIIEDPYKIDGDKNYRAKVKCQFCDSEPYDMVLSEIKRHVFDGCGCQNNKSITSKWVSFKDWCINNGKEEFFNLWDYKLNNKIPEDVSYCTSDKYYFKCPNGKHQSSLWKIINITNSNKTKTICRYCNSFAQHAIDKYGNDVLDLYWDYDKNKISPYDILYGSKKEIWIKCQSVNYHGSYSTDPKRFLEGCRCPYCNGKLIHPNDSFANFYIEKHGNDFLKKYWDYDKNVLNPWEIAVTTNKTLWFKCEKHGSYKIIPSNLIKKEIYCPMCSKEKEKSSFQLKTENYIKHRYNYNILHEYDCSIVALNPNTKKTMPYDNDVIINENIHLIIEVNGTQHYYATSGWNRLAAKRLNTSPDKVLKNVQWRDKYKKQFAIDNGYFYLEIPSFAFKTDKYKTLIDTKIHEILSLTNEKSN